MCKKFGTLAKRSRTKRHLDFSSQKFCNETSLGQNVPWDKAVLGQNIFGKFATKRPDFHGRNIKLGTIFSDKMSLTHKKLLRLRLPCCCLGSPDPAARPRRRYPGGGPGGPAPAAQPRLPRENDAALAPTVSASAIRLHKKFGANLVHFLNKI
jgi:hypothetical protein